MSSISWRFLCFFFADDTNMSNIFLSQNDFLERTLNKEFLTPTAWCQANTLSVNYSKSKFMVFKPRQKRQNFDIKLEISDRAIERVRDIIFFMLTPILFKSRLKAFLLSWLSTCGYADLVFFAALFASILFCLLFILTYISTWFRPSFIVFIALLKLGRELINVSKTETFGTVPDCPS